MCVPLSPSALQELGLAVLAILGIEIVATAIDDNDEIDGFPVDRDAFCRQVRARARAACTPLLEAPRWQGGGADAFNRCVRLAERNAGCIP